MSTERLDELRYNIRQQQYIDESVCVKELMRITPLNKEARLQAETTAIHWVEKCRSTPEKQELLDAFLQEYSLSSEEGIALMSLAEALLRVPDSHTAKRLIAEKIHSGQWQSHQGKSEKLLVNAATLGLRLTEKLIRPKEGGNNSGNGLQHLLGRVTEPAVRFGVMQSMKLMGQQYILGRTISEAIQCGAKLNGKNARFSFDMLGEGARTFTQADIYFDAYMEAIHKIGEKNTEGGVYEADGISVKLSALHPRYQFSQRQQILEDMLPRVRELALEAKRLNIGFTIDAEEVARLDISLDIFQALARDPELQGWHGLGFVLQAYQKRALAVVDWLIELAKSSERRLMIRLVKGAYWDAEIKHAQEQGLADYPVFTRKAHTDLSYQVCAYRLLQQEAYIYPQFATHNAYTIAMIMTLVGDCQNLSQRMEFQRLHGMGKLLYGEVANQQGQPFPLRIYAPVGSHSDLLPYLVRRLLENGANSSFVNQFLDNKIPASDIVGNVEDTVTALPDYRHSKIPLPENVYRLAGDLRSNSRGIDLDNPLAVKFLQQGVQQSQKMPWKAASIVGGKVLSGEYKKLHSPADTRLEVGQYVEASIDDVSMAVSLAAQAQTQWQASGAEHRATILEKAADLMEGRTELLTGLIALEAGRALIDGVSEVREAVDFCRYYAAQIRELSDDYPNAKSLHQGRGVFVCISPWNFPLAIFIGQVVAALVTGNTVIAKPAEQTPLIASIAVEILHEAGVPVNALHLLLGPGSVLGPRLTSEQCIAGVAFTGSTETAQRIQISLAERGGTMPPLIAETGGQNVMLVDSTALTEQVVDDVINSAFLSAGQRCSALRVLYIQEEVAERTIDMLRDALSTLTIGEPWELSTDIGPVVDDNAKQTLLDHLKRMEREAIFIGKAELPENCPEGHYLAPHIYELDSITQLHREVFGPILHIVRYKSQDLNKVLDEINATGYGLTMGIHSRIQGLTKEVFRKNSVGNTYINRNMVGAVVGVNPFGGQGLSGTGFKAGGPHYLLRFSNLWPSADNPLSDTERVTPAINTDIEMLLQRTSQAQRHWDLLGGIGRSEILDKVLKSRDHFEINGQLMFQCQQLLDDAHNQFSGTIALPGPTGESNRLSLHGRGVFLLYLHSGGIDTAIQQMIAALAAGNGVLIATTEEYRSMGNTLVNGFSGELPDLVHLISDSVDLNSLLAHDNIAGVVTNNGAPIIMQLAQRSGAIIPLVTHLNGPFALLPYAVEKTYTDNIVATGGNALLLNLRESIV